MYKFLRGKIDKKYIDHISLDINGVGYYVNMPSRIIDVLLTGSEYKVYVYLAVRENDMELFGFITEEEQTLFKKLISISKVGPRTALNILDMFNPSDFVKVISDGDIKELSKVSGIGKKGAGRIILEMKGKINFDDFNDDNVIIESNNTLKMVDEALKNFGYSSEDIKPVLKEIENKFDENASDEELIKFALQNIGK